MYQDEGTRGGVGTAEAARCSNGGKGAGGLCQWFQWGGGKYMTKWGKTTIQMLRRAHLSLGGG